MVSSNPTTFAAMIRRLDQRHDLRGHRRGLRQAGVDEPGGHVRAGHVGEQLPAPLHRHVLEDQQVDGQRPQPRADRDRGVRDAGRAGRHVGLPARAPALVQVMLDRSDACGSGTSFCWYDRATPRSAAPPGPRRTRRCPRGSSRGSIRDRSRSSPPPAPRLLAPPALLRRVPLRRPPLLPGRLAARRVIHAGRHRGVPAVPRHGPLQPRPAAPAGQRPPPPAPRSAPPASRSAAPAPGSAHHADPPAAHRSQPRIIPETTLSHHGNTTPAAKT